MLDPVGESIAETMEMIEKADSSVRLSAWGMEQKMIMLAEVEKRRLELKRTIAAWIDYLLHDGDIASVATHRERMN